MHKKYQNEFIKNRLIIWLLTKYVLGYLICKSYKFLIIQNVSKCSFKYIHI